MSANATQKEPGEKKVTDVILAMVIVTHGGNVVQHSCNAAPRPGNANAVYSWLTTHQTQRASVCAVVFVPGQPVLRLTSGPYVLKIPSKTAPFRTFSSHLDPYASEQIQPPSGFGFNKDEDWNAFRTPSQTDSSSFSCFSDHWGAFHFSLIHITGHYLDKRGCAFPKCYTQNPNVICPESLKS